MQEFMRVWSYPGVFIGILATGLGFPMPEELPVVIGGSLMLAVLVRILQPPTRVLAYRWLERRKGRKSGVGGEGSEGTAGAN